ncbi:uncharacterized protein LOC141640735 [Silene latifolia]|uniref:uncharacterized protein LOC141640735 n=1 Tax=Silene latifolia TaxID=37657 RepID=UPI003D76CE83
MDQSTSTSLGIPQSAHAKGTKSVNEIVGIPKVDLDAIVEEEPTESMILVEDASELGNEDDDGDGWQEVRHVKKTPTPPSSPKSGVLQFTVDDVKSAIEYWSTAVICYVLEGNPPWELISGHIKRIWGQHHYDKLSFLPNGVFTVRFPTLECKNLVLQHGYPMFDNKPIGVHPWTEDALLIKAPVKRQYVRADNATLDKTRLGFARLMVEVQVGQEFPDKLYFNDEHGRQNCVIVEYEWKPIICSVCKGIGQHQSLCRKPSKPKPKVTQVWKPKTVVPSKVVVDPTSMVTTAAQSSSMIGTNSTLMTNDSLAPNLGGEATRVSADLSYADALTSPLRSPSNGSTQAQPVTANQGGPATKDSTENKVGLYGLVETKVKSTNFTTVLNNIGQRWYGINNNMHHPGGRVWIIWLPQIFNVHLVHSSDQQITVDVTNRQSVNHFWFTVVYGSNSDTERIIVNWWILKPRGLSIPGITNKTLILGSAAPMLRKTSSRYFNMWGQSKDFANIVQSKWDKLITGVRMYQVVSKLKTLKKPLKDLNKQNFSDIDNAADLAWFLLDSLQTKLHLNPHDMNLREAEQQAAQNYNTLHRAQMSFMRQKAKVEWLKGGDENTGFFHKQIKARHIQNKVLSIKDTHGTLHKEPVLIENAFLEFYTDLLGTSRQTSSVHIPTVRTGKLITDQQKSLLLRHVTYDEIKKYIFSIPSSKAPGHDGYSSQFFKDSWDIIGNDVSAAITDFFNTGQLLKQLNATLVTLIPKVANPSSVHEFRPIACCNVIYKCIAKLLCARLSDVLPDIISPNQGGFIKGRNIVENVLICQDLVRLYKRKSASPRCLIKIDLRKAYDTIEWSFLHSMLVALNFPTGFIDKIMTCVTTTAYSLSLSGNSFGFFKGKRGLRQGDPLSPLLFTICMEYLSRILHVISNQDDFRFHPLCRPLKLNHLLFADDLLLFSKGTASSIMWMLRAFSTFSKASGLCFNREKSDIYFNGVPSHVMTNIIQVSGFRQGELPFRYLGVPISSHKLSKNDGMKLTDRITARIRYWGTRQLSYTGRLTLINSVLTSLHSYWASMFLIPNGIMNKIGAICRNFLWSGKDSYQRSPNVSWDRCCSPKDEGGFGIKDLKNWNRALLGKYIWWLAKKKDHLWLDVEKDSLYYVPSLSKPTLMIVADECHDYLFFSCQFSMKCIRSLQSRLGVHFSANNLSQWAANGRTRSKHQRNIISACHVGVTYVIWTARNKARLDNYVMHPEYIAKTVIKDVVMRFWAKNTSALPAKDISWLRQHS